MTNSNTFTPASSADIPLPHLKLPRRPRVSGHEMRNPGAARTTLHPTAALAAIEASRVHAPPHACCQGTRLRDLAAARGFDASTMSRRVSHLCETGLLERSPDPQDGRAKLLSLSDDGRRAMAEERARRVHLITESLGEWTQQDKGDLARMISRLNDSLENA